ncbi:unnamed protein product [Callosobruchus maculatus]|uniref:Uncharacterized protein n=1 Tax=Callosobruchus maculatus TaxID=64391 RepID=A0A653DUZ4_CALMS|nr:unnamed protein product [Callosobruchus maculatus]
MLKMQLEGWMEPAAVEQEFVWKCQMDVPGEGVVEEEDLVIQGQDHHADLVAPDLGLAPETLGADRTPETDDKMEENGTKIHVFILSIYHDLFHQGWTMLD